MFSPLSAGCGGRMTVREDCVYGWQNSQEGNNAPRNYYTCTEVGTVGGTQTFIWLVRGVCCFLCSGFSPRLLLFYVLLMLSTPFSRCALYPYRILCIFAVVRVWPSAGMKLKTRKPCADPDRGSDYRRRHGARRLGRGWGDDRPS